MILFLSRLRHGVTSSSWISGMLDADGTVNCNQNSYQLSFSISQKNRYILDLIANALGIGHVYYYKSWDGYIYYVSSKTDLDIVLNYFEKYLSRVSPKNQDLLTLKLLKDCKSKGMHLLMHPQHKDFLILTKKLVHR